MRGAERILDALRLGASTFGLLVALTAAGVVGLAVGELVPDRSLPIALGVLLLAVLTPDVAEVDRGGHRKRGRATGGAPVA